jgi:soluble lytic murein transglycosylase-like protein
VKRSAATALTAVLIIVVGAAGSMATSRSSRSHPRASVYVVRPGDTLGSIAATLDTTTTALTRANRLRNPNVVVVGQRLTVPAGATGARAGRLPATLRAHPERLALRPQLRRWAAYYGVAPDLLQALTWVESGWQREIVSRAGAKGIGQLMPDTVALTWRMIGRSLDPFRADDNIRMTARFLRYLLDATGGSVTTSLAAYYQGLRAVRTGPIHAETLVYVATVLAVRPSFQ